MGYIVNGHGGWIDSGPLGTVIDCIRRGRMEQAAKVAVRHHLDEEAFSACVVQAATGARSVAALEQATWDAYAANEGGREW